ncbi:MAG: DUF1826 domain-containing protein [Pseudomonadota bacterium]
MFELTPSDQVSCADLRELAQSEAGGKLKSITDDLIDLSTMFSEANGQPDLLVKLETIEDDRCRKFHLDNVKARLVVTYHGPGTQWVTPGDEERALHEQTAFTGPISEVAVGNVAMFFGKKSDRATLILHRSAPIESRKLRRLVAVIDFASA